jgi:hypothetical protein
MSSCNFSIEQQIEDLKKKDLKDGWYDGEGKGLPKKYLNETCLLLKNNYNSINPTPYIYPSTEGGITLEWSFRKYEVSLEINIKYKTAYWHCLNTSTDKIEENNLDLIKSKSWDFINDRIRFVVAFGD